MGFSGNLALQEVAPAYPQQKRPKTAFLTYYGGKQNIANKIIEIMPPHRIYCEVFAGGGAVLAMKPPAENSVINDKDGRIANFYRVLKEKPDEFIRKINLLLYDEYLYKKYKQIYKSEVEGLDAAVAVWYVQFCFGGDLGGGFSFDSDETSIKKFKSKKESIKNLLGILENVTIFNRDAINILNLECYNKQDTLYYIDPPYVGANQGHYSGYTKQDFKKLIQTIKKINGKFILSHYRTGDSEIEELLKPYNFIEIDTRMTVTLKRGDESQRKRTEVLYYNYDLKNSTLF